MLAIVKLILSLLAAFIPFLVWILGRRIPPHFERRSITCEYGKSGSVIAEGVSGVGLKVEHNSRPIDEPHVMRLIVSNTGGRALTGSMFDGGRPLKFDLGVEVIAFTRESCYPRTAPKLAAGISGNVFSLGPGLIQRKMSACYLVLTDGMCVEVRCENPIVDTEVKEVELLDEEGSHHGLNVKAVVQWLLIGLVVWWVATQPGNAGHLVNSIGSLLSNAASGLVRFVTSS